MTIDQKHPEVARKFYKGHFVVHKSCQEFSSIAIDQAHKQSSAVIKDDGGAIGLKEEPTALQRWMIDSWTRIEPSSRSRYEQVAGTKDATISSKHHKQAGKCSNNIL